MFNGRNRDPGSLFYPYEWFYCTPAIILICIWPFMGCVRQRVSMRACVWWVFRNRTAYANVSFYTGASNNRSDTNEINEQRTFYKRRTSYTSYSKKCHRSSPFQNDDRNVLFLYFFHWRKLCVAAAMVVIATAYFF